MIVQTEGLQKIYGDKKAERAALSGVSLGVRQGEFLAVLGPSGSGKSTLLGIIGALDRAYSGKVELFGQDISRMSDKELAYLRAHKIGFVFQAFHLLAHLSVLENVLMPSLFEKHPSEDLSARAKGLLKRLGLRERADARPSELSGGQRQRVSVARALLMRPELLLCDEPTGNLDAETGAQTIELFKELHGQGQLTIIAVTHEERLAGAATRVIRLRDGRVDTSEKAEGEGETR